MAILEPNRPILASFKANITILAQLAHFANLSNISLICPKSCDFQAIIGQIAFILASLTPYEKSNISGSYSAYEPHLWHIIARFQAQISVI